MARPRETSSHVPEEIAPLKTTEMIWISDPMSRSQMATVASSPEKKLASIQVAY
jgi:hypothetical protein